MGGGQNKAPFGATRHFPQRGKIHDGEIFPLWGKYRRSRGRGASSCICSVCKISVIARRIAPKQPKATSPKVQVRPPGYFATLSITR